MPMTVESTMERGTLRSGSVTSPPTYVTSIQPSYAHNTATRATPNDAIRCPGATSDQRGARFDALPPGNANPATMSTTSRAILMSVSTFCVTAPSRTPSKFSAVSPTMDRTATSLMPAPESGTKKLKYVAKPTAIAAMDAGLITTPLVQP